MVVALEKMLAVYPNTDYQSLEVIFMNMLPLHFAHHCDRLSAAGSNYEKLSRLRRILKQSANDVHPDRNRYVAPTNIRTVTERMKCLNFLIERVSKALREEKEKKKGRNKK